MIQRNLIEEIINAHLQDSPVFIVDFSISTSNKIIVHIESESGLKISDCVALSRAIEGSLDREKEDFELEVSSPGVGKPFKVNKQYRINIGRKVEIIFETGEKIEAKLLSADDQKIEVEYLHLEKIPGEKKKIKELKQQTIEYNKIKSTTVLPNL